MAEIFQSPFPQECAFSALSEQAQSSERLHSQEKKLADAISSPQTRAAFMLGRQAARAALRAIDARQLDKPILRGARREPIWPEGISGSIAHTTVTTELGSDLWAVAVVSKSSSYRGLGIDIEPTQRAGVLTSLPRIASAEEQAWINADAAQAEKHALALFSAKESLFKALYPLTGTVFGLRDAVLERLEGTNGFSAVLQRDLNREFRAGQRIEISLVESVSWLLTAVTIPS